MGQSGEPWARGGIDEAAPLNWNCTLSEARRRANGLRQELNRREAHPEVFRFCRDELLADNYFHAVLEAAKSVAERVRVLAGVSLDGHELVEAAFGTSNGGPRVVVNTRQTKSERSEHDGIAHLLRGLFTLFRNPTAHEPKITCNMTENEALEALALISLLHRRLANATSVPRAFVGKP